MKLVLNLRWLEFTQVEHKFTQVEYIFLLFKNIFLEKKNLHSTCVNLCKLKFTQVLPKNTQVISSLYWVYDFYWHMQFILGLIICNLTYFILYHIDYIYLLIVTYYDAFNSLQPGRARNRLIEFITGFNNVPWALYTLSNGKSSICGDLKLV